MDELEILGIAKTYTKETVIGMGALKGAPCTVQGVVDNGDGTQTLTLRWTGTTGTTHDSTIVLPSAIFEITSPQNGQTLKYNSTSGKFENSNTAFSADLGDLDDVVITTVQNGQVLSYDSATGKWINKTVSIAADLGDLDDVTIASVSNGQVLAYDSASSKWKNISLGTAAAKDSTNAVTQNDTDLVESGAVYTAIDDAVKALDVTDTAVAGSYVTEVSETDGKISVTREAADAAPTASSKKMVESGGVYSAIDDAVKALDVTDTAVAGSYVTEVSETDGKISVTREAADATPTANSKKMVQSGGVYASEDAIFNLMGIMGAKNLVPFPFFNDSPWDSNGITFTVNSDNSITISGIASADAYFRLTYYTGNNHVNLQNGTAYILSATGYADIAMQLRDSTNTRVESSRATDVTYQCDNTGDYDVIISVDNGADFTTPVTIYPMLRIATDTDNTYQPYAKTNRELTSDSLQSVSVNGVAQTITNGASDLDVATNLITTAQWTTLSTLYATT